MPRTPDGALDALAAEVALGLMAIVRPAHQRKTRDGDGTSAGKRHETMKLDLEGR